MELLSLGRAAFWCLISALCTESIHSSGYVTFPNNFWYDYVHSCIAANSVFCKRSQLIGACIFFFMTYAVIVSTVKLATDQFPTNYILERSCSCAHNNVTYDFCYHLPKNRVIKGRPFDCNFITYLDELEILPSKKIVDLMTEEMPIPAFVTAMSQNHYEEGLTLIANLRSLWPRQKIIVYDLGLSPESKKELQPAYMLHSPSHHSIFATTHPGMYNYIPTDIEAIKKNESMNYDANFQFIVRTTDALEILKWYVLCALEKECMAPYAANVWCDFENDRYYRYAGCHRYDQSAINLLLANSYGYNIANYVSNLGDGAVIDRSAKSGLTEADFSCKERVVHS